MTKYPWTRIAACLLLCLAVEPAVATVIVGHWGLQSLRFYADKANGTAVPQREIGGPASQVGATFTLTVDALNDELWVADNQRVAVFAINANGNVAPKRQFDIPAGSRALAVAVDNRHNEVFVSDFEGSAVMVFPRTASGSPAPLRQIKGPVTQISFAGGIAYDPVTDQIVVTSRVDVDAVLFFPRTANGNVAPARKIAGPNTHFEDPTGLVLDVARRELIVIDRGTGQVSTFDFEASGNASPKRRIQGAVTDLQEPFSAALDLLGNLYVANGSGYDVLVFPRTANGNVAPTRTIQSGQPSDYVYGVAVWQPPLRLRGGRFLVDAMWRVNAADIGGGTPGQLTSDTGDFWFFDSANLEMVVKVLDGCASSSRFWVFAGGLTNVRVNWRVTDTATGAEKLYANPPDQKFQPLQDTAAFATCGAAFEPVIDDPVRDAAAPAEAWDAVCQGLCLNNNRFQVRANWQTAVQSGAGVPFKITSDTGDFWFFDAANVELLVKVINGCGLNGNYWVFAGGLTNQAVQLVVTDTLTQQERTYNNPLDTPFQPLQDTSAFATCP
jgi:6-phosphogluconolactonase (cycloisomerase 2 family)